MNRFSGILDMFFYTTDTIDGEKTSLAFFISHKGPFFANFLRQHNWIAHDGITLDEIVP